MSKKYTKEHEWIEITAAGRARIGVTDFAQEQLGDVVMIDPPEVGSAIRSRRRMRGHRIGQSRERHFLPAGGQGRGD